MLQSALSQSAPSFIHYMNPGAGPIVVRTSSEDVPDFFRPNTSTLWISPRHTPRLDPRVLSTEDLVAAHDDLSQQFNFDRIFLDRKRDDLAANRRKLAEKEQVLQASRSLSAGQSDTRVAYEVHQLRLILDSNIEIIREYEVEYERGAGILREYSLELERRKASELDEVD